MDNFDIPSLMFYDEWEIHKERHEYYMDQRIVDLHVHTTESDGTLTPQEVIAEAADAGLSAIALTDHDTCTGIAKAKAAADACGIELIPGIELSTEYAPFSKEVHIVGLFIDTQNELLLQKTKEFRECRDNRNALIIEALQKEGFAITMDAVTAENPDRVITRANIARFLYEHHCVKSIREAFDTYIGDGCRCYVGRLKISPMEAVTLIRQAGGIAVLAHPLLYHLGSAALQQLIDDVKAVGLVGIEALYSTYSVSEEQSVKRLAAQNGLLISGGSDFHGANKSAIRLGSGLGRLHIPYSVLEALRASLPTK